MLTKMANYDFKKDLILGVKGERVVKEFLESLGGKFIESNNDNKFDLKFLKNNEEITYEIKTDVFCSPTRDTGNICIEYQCRGKASGISVTEAKWFVTYFKHFNQLWFIRTEDLKKLISENNFRTFSQGGDINSNTCGYLINRENYKEYFNIYNI